MLNLYPDNTTRVLAEGQEEFNKLPIVDVTAEDGSPFMCSLWKPTIKELEALLNGGDIVLSIMGLQHPPVKLYVRDCKAEIVKES